MSAGTGVMHSEFNNAPAQATHFLQIWIQPKQLGVKPGYEQRHYSAADKRGRLALVASGDAAEGAVAIHADARLYAGLFDADEAAELTIAAGRLAYVHLVRGQAVVNGQAMKAGDALQMTEQAKVTIEQGVDAELLVFDLAS
jgi:redox-sensitive bicupin YhaK (pirin superfamily)